MGVLSVGVTVATVAGGRDWPDWIDLLLLVSAMGCAVGYLCYARSRWEWHVLVVVLPMLGFFVERPWRRFL